MAYFNETFCDDGSPNETQKDDLMWLNDHPDCLRRIRPLHKYEQGIEATLARNIFGVAIEKIENGLRKFYFDESHPFAKKLVSSN